MADLIKCDVCGKESEDVICYEGYGVGLRACKGSCDKDYLAKVKEIKDAAKVELQTVVNTLKASVKVK